MAHWTEDLHELCEKITEEISEANKKLDKAGGKMTAGDLEYIDKLTHALKSIKTTLAMEEYDEEDGYSGARGDGRGRGRNARRDSMGRYSRDGGYSMEDRGGSYDGYSNNMGRGYSDARRGGRGGYSRDDAKAEMVEQLRDLKMSAPDEETRRMVDKWIRQAEMD